MALGGRTFKLKFGHHGANHPVKDLPPARWPSRCRTTASAWTSTPRTGASVEITHMNLNDRTLEGMRHKRAAVFSRAVPPGGLAGPPRRAATCSAEFIWNCMRKEHDCRRRTDIKKILIIGSGPIIIGQACEFDYSGTQACKALREEGYEVVLVNSNPATIMTDPEMARPHVHRADHAGGRREDHRAASGPTRCCRPSAARRA